MHNGIIGSNDDTNNDHDSCYSLFYSHKTDTTLAIYMYYDIYTIAYDGRSYFPDFIDYVTQIQVKWLVQGQWPVEGRARIRSQIGLAPKSMLFLPLWHFLQIVLERYQFWKSIRRTLHLALKVSRQGHRGKINDIWESRAPKLFQSVFILAVFFLLFFYTDILKLCHSPRIILFNKMTNNKP